METWKGHSYFGSEMRLQTFNAFTKSMTGEGFSNHTYEIRLNLFPLFFVTGANRFGLWWNKSWSTSLCHPRRPVLSRPLSLVKDGFGSFCEESSPKRTGGIVSTCILLPTRYVFKTMNDCHIFFLHVFVENSGKMAWAEGKKPGANWKGKFSFFICHHFCGSCYYQKKASFSFLKFHL